MHLENVAKKLNELSLEEQKQLSQAIQDLVDLPKKNQSNVLHEIYSQKEKARIEDLGLGWYYGH